MNQVHNNKSGFTIVELMLAMSFVAGLLLAIAMTVIQIGNIYNRGITFKNVNQVGSSIAKELQNSINVSSPFNVSGTNNRFINSSYGGRLCTGRYSFIWNYGKNLKIASTLNKYSDGTNINFTKISDPNYSYCINPSSAVNKTFAVELLDVGQFDLAIHSFSITSAASATDSLTGQKLYSVIFEIGTNDQAALIPGVSGVSDWLCRPPSDSGSDSIYCSVNRFNIVARAGSTVNK